MNKDQMIIDESFYILVNDRGMYFKGKGFNNPDGKQWTYEILKCKMYKTYSSAQRVLAYFLKNPKEGFKTPTIKNIAVKINERESI